MIAKAPVLSCLSRLGRTVKPEFGAGMIALRYTPWRLAFSSHEDRFAGNRRRAAGGPRRSDPVLYLPHTLRHHMRTEKRKDHSEAVQYK
jgi:hypothetical protein